MVSDPASLELTQPACEALRISDIEVFMVLDLSGQELNRAGYMPGQTVAAGERCNLGGRSTQFRGRIGIIKVRIAAPLPRNPALYMCRALQNTYLVKLCVDSP